MIVRAQSSELKSSVRLQRTADIGRPARLEELLHRRWDVRRAGRGGDTLTAVRHQNVVQFIVCQGGHRTGRAIGRRRCRSGPQAAAQPHPSRRVERVRIHEVHALDEPPDGPVSGHRLCERFLAGKGLRGTLPCHETTSPGQQVQLRQKNLQATLCETFQFGQGTGRQND